MCATSNVFGVSRRQRVDATPLRGCKLRAASQGAPTPQLQASIRNGAGISAYQLPCSPHLPLDSLFLLPRKLGLFPIKSVTMMTAVPAAVVLYITTSRNKYIHTSYILADLCRAVATFL